MTDWIKKAFEDCQGVPDDARVSAFLLVVAFIGNTITAVIMNPAHVFNAQDFGIGAGALAAGIGAWFGIRKGN